jgi:hypothetical protein
MPEPGHFYRRPCRREKGPGSPSLLVHLIGVSLSQKEELAGLDEISRDDPIEVHSAGESRGVEADFVGACLLFTVHEL